MPTRTPDSPQLLAEEIHRFIREDNWDDAYDAFGKLHDRLHPQLMGVAKRKTRLENAEDMVGEALMSLYRQLKNKGCPENVEAWTIDVLNRRIADYYRLKRNTQEKLASPTFWDEHARRQKAPTGSGADPFKETAKKEEDHHLNVLLDNLPPELRAIIDAHYYDELAWEAVGAELGLSLDVVKKRAKQALVFMRNMAAKRGFKHDN